jgi:hypothetical protein
VGAIGVERAGNAIRREDLPQSREYGVHALAAFEQMRVEQPLGGVIHHGDEGVQRVGHEGQPAMATAVQVQQLAEAGPRLAAPPMPAARAPLRPSAAPCRAWLDEAVGQANAVVALRD